MPEFFDEKDREILELDTRKRVYGVVEDYPGSHFREIERISGLSVGSARHHLAHLARHGLIREERDGNNLRYFPRGFNPKNKRLMGILRRRSMRRILLCLASKGSCNHQQIVGFVRLSPSTISWHLKKLEQEGIIISKKIGRNTAYSLLAKKGDIVHLLITYRESFLDSIVDNVVEMWDVG
ncbi:MAG TPA: winged helix-turn-helix transcriptional regulator [Candidatus Nanoarchaeia archaeon]|nr:winged helix-turn-helix transcriptional regulator [Candidatus Nanoarchaeia archaeon]